MNIRMIVILTIVLFSIVVPTAQTQPSEQEVGKILECKGQAFVITGDDEKPAGVNMVLRSGDKIRNNDGAEVEFQLGKVHLCLKENSEVEIHGPFRQKLLYGKIRVLNLPEPSRILTPRENIAGKGTDFVVMVQDAGTIVEVLEGQVEVRRKGEDIESQSQDMGTTIIRDHKAWIPAGKPLEIISDRPFGKQMLLSVVPGTGTIYARTNIKRAFVFQLLSTAVLVVAITSNEIKSNAREDSIEAYNDYKAEIRLANMEESYNRYSDNVDKANKFRRIRNYLIAAYGGLLACETVFRTLDYMEYRKMIREARQLEQELQSSKAGIEVRDDAVLAKIQCSFN